MRVKDRKKSCFWWFLGLSLLLIHTETLVTQAKRIYNSLPFVPSDKNCFEETSFPSLVFPFSYFVDCLKSKAFIVRHFETSAQLIISHDRWSEQISL